MKLWVSLGSGCGGGGCGCGGGGGCGGGDGIDDGWTCGGWMESWAEGGSKAMMEQLGLIGAETAEVGSASKWIQESSTAKSHSTAKHTFIKRPE